MFARLPCAGATLATLRPKRAKGFPKFVDVGASCVRFHHDGVTRSQLLGLLYSRHTSRHGVSNFTVPMRDGAYAGHSQRAIIEWRPPAPQLPPAHAKIAGR